MQIDDDYLNDKNLDLFKSGIYRQDQNLWAFYKNIFICTRYKDGERIEASFKSESSKDREFWIILSLQRDGIHQPFKVKSSKIKIVNGSFMPEHENSIDIEIGNKIKSDFYLPYRTQTAWKMIKEILPSLDIEI